MKLLPIFASLAAALSLVTPLAAQDGTIDKIGTVSIQKLVDAYYKTGLVQKQFEVYQEEIKKENEERFEAIKDLVEEVREISKMGDDSSLTPEKKDEFFREAAIKNQRATTLRNERIAWAKRKQAALSEKAIVEFAKLRADIVVIVKRIGVERDYDFILDRSGSSGAQVAILSYAKDATDLTAVLLKEINKDAPAESDEGDDESGSE